MSDPTPDPEPAPAPAADPTPEAMEDALRLAEAMVFAAAAPVGARALANLLPVGIDPDAVVAALRQRYAGRGVELARWPAGCSSAPRPTWRRGCAGWCRCRGGCRGWRWKPSPSLPTTSR